MADYNTFGLGDIGANLGDFGSFYNYLNLTPDSWQAPTDMYDNVSGNSGEFNWTPETLEQFKNYQFGQHVNPDMRVMTDIFKDGTFDKSIDSGAYDKNFDMQQALLGSIMAGAGFAPLAGALGGGIFGNLLSGGILGGATAAGTGQDVGKGVVSGAVGGALQSGAGAFNPGSMAGIDNPALQKMFNTGLTSTVGGLAKGQDFGDAAKSGLFSAAGSGLNSLSGMLFSPASSTGGDLDSLPGSMGYPSEDTLAGVDQPNQFGDYRSFVSPSDITGGALSQGMGAAGEERQRPQSSGGLGDTLSGMFSNFQGSFPGVSSFLGNNLGDITSALYGMYNQRKNMKGLKSRMGALSGLSDPNGAYAKQLRGRLERKDAQMGRRSDYAGRETQLMAQLAQMGAQTAPAMFQMQNAQNQLRNNNMVQLMKLGQTSGLFGKLGDMFKTQAPTPSMLTSGLSSGSLDFGHQTKMPDWANLSLYGPGG